MANALSPAIEEVKKFHVAAGMPVRDRPEFPNVARRMVRRQLLMEEFDQFTRSLQEQDMAGCAHALTAIIYCAIGTALETGIPLCVCWDELQRSNMAVVNPATGKVFRKPDGKLRKPKGWQPPDIEGIIRTAGG